MELKSIIALVYSSLLDSRGFPEHIDGHCNILCEPISSLLEIKFPGPVPLHNA